MDRQLKSELYSPDLSPFPAHCNMWASFAMAWLANAARQQMLHSFMKTRHDDQIYEVLGFYDGRWVWHGSDDATVPQEVYDRLAREIAGMFAVGEQVYWIRLARKEPEQ